MHNRILGLLALAMMVTPLGAQATLLTYNFGVTATSGPLAGTSATGTFGFDDSIIPTGGGTVIGPDLLTDLDFTWNGIAYDENTANTGGFIFDSLGNMTLAVFGNDCSAATCGVSGGVEGWYARFLAPPVFAYSTTGDITIGDGTTYLSPVAVPEPAPLALMGFGLAGLVFARKRKAA